MILGPEHPHAKSQADSAARKEAQTILDNRGNSPRNYKNTLVFLAADATRLKELQAAVRQCLAWKSIWDEREQLNLDPFQAKQAEAKRKGVRLGAKPKYLGVQKEVIQMREEQKTWKEICEVLNIDFKTAKKCIEV